MTKKALSVVASFGTIVSGSDSITIVIEPFAAVGAAGLTTAAGAAWAGAAGFAASAGLAGSAGFAGGAGACGVQAANRPATPAVAIPYAKISRRVNRRLAGAAVARLMSLRCCLGRHSIVALPSLFCAGSETA